MSLKWPNKDPDEVLDYVLDWTLRLDGDVIASSIWEVPSQITKDSDNHDFITTTIWLSGGTEGDSVTVVNRITTAGDRTMDQSVIIKIKSK